MPSREEVLNTIVHEGKSYCLVNYRTIYYARIRFTKRERKWKRDKSHRRRRMGWARTDSPRKPLQWCQAVMAPGYYGFVFTTTALDSLGADHAE